MPDCFLGKPIFGWHFEVAVYVGYSVEEKGILGFSRDDGGAGVATGLPSGSGVEEEVGLQLFGVSRVTFVTVLDEKWANVSLKEFDSFLFLAMCPKAARNQSESDFRLR
jgi:hypothetical protein